MPGPSHDNEVTALRQQLVQLQAHHAKHDEEIEQLKQEHTAQVAAVQTQAINKMKELIDKVGLIRMPRLQLCASHRGQILGCVAALFANCTLTCTVQHAHFKQHITVVHQACQLQLVTSHVSNPGRWRLSSGRWLCQVKQQTMAERQQWELRLEEAHQAEENAVAQMQQLRRECRQGPRL